MNTATYKAFDDDAFVALANKGLLRRAQKDLDRTPPEPADETLEAVTFAFPEDNCHTTLPATGPAQACCTCAADGVCRHILVGALLLRARPEDHVEQPVFGTPQPTLPDEVLQLAEADLVRWASRAVFRQALDELAGGEIDVVIEETDSAVVFRLPQHNVAVRWIVGAGVAGMVCLCKRPGACKHRVAAVLAYQCEHGQPLPELAQHALKAATGTPRTREDVLQAVQHTLTEIVALGWDRLATMHVDRLRTLAISAHGVDLPRLERALRALADQLRWQIERDVRADARRLLDAVARTYALAWALHHTQPAPAALVGEHRARYFDVGSLELVGVGAQQWRTRSGYAGLTVFAWDTAARRWNTWSDSRPAFPNNVRFDPHQRYINQPACRRRRGKQAAACCAWGTHAAAAQDACHRTRGCKPWSVLPATRRPLIFTACASTIGHRWPITLLPHMHRG